ncbi:hypothetical protein BH09VER1_BH09VER1_53100 [soil metagenome]
MLGDQVSADFYATWLGLSQEERKELNQLTMDDEFLEKIVGDYVLVWKRRQKAATPVVYIRRLILLRAAMAAVKYSFDRECSYRVELAFSLWLCERVEYRASELGKAGWVC